MRHRQRTALSSGRDRHFAEPPVVILGGVILGTIAGLPPGIGPSTAIALLPPVAITVPAEISLPLMVSLCTWAPNTAAGSPRSC